MSEVTTSSDPNRTRPNPPPPPLPQPPAVDQDWATKIERAKEARESGQRLREGMPVAFPTRRQRQ